MKRSMLTLVFAGLALGSLASAQAAVETYDIDPRAYLGRFHFLTFLH